MPAHSSAYMNALESFKDMDAGAKTQIQCHFCERKGVKDEEQFPHQSEKGNVCRECFVRVCGKSHEQADRDLHVDDLPPAA